MSVIVPDADAHYTLAKAAGAVMITDIQNFGQRAAALRAAISKATSGISGRLIPGTNRLLRSRAD